MKILIEYLVSLLGAAVGSAITGGVWMLLETNGSQPMYGGDKGPAIMGICIGLPLGSVAGAILCDRFLYRTKRTSIYSISSAVLFSMAISCLGILGLDFFGASFMLVVPLLAVMASFVGFRAGFAFERTWMSSGRAS